MKLQLFEHQERRNIFVARQFFGAAWSWLSYLTIIIETKNVWFGSVFHSL